MPIATLSINEALYEFLTDNSTFNDSIGGSAGVAGRLRWDRADPDDTMPYVVMSLVSLVNLDGLQNDGFSARFHFTCYAETTAAAAQGIADKLLARLHRGGDLAISGHTNMHPFLDLMLGATQEEEAWRVDLDFIIEGFAS